MTYVLDLLLVAIIVLCIWRGYKKGLVRTAVRLAGVVLAVLLAESFGAAVAEWGYTTLAAPRIENALVEKVTQSGDLSSEISLTGLLGSQEALDQYFTALGLPTSVNIGVPDTSEASVRGAVSSAMESVVRPGAMLLLTALAKIGILLVTLLAAALLARLLDKTFRKLPVLKQLNAAGGTLIGVILGAFWALVFVTAVQLALRYGLLGSAITAQTVENTYIFSRLARLDLFF